MSRFALHHVLSYIKPIRKLAYRCGYALLFNYQYYEFRYREQTT